MTNRHGLIAGATGTGKTRTLQVIAEQLSAAGVSVFVADVKGDLSGLAAPGPTDGPAAKRAADLGIPFTPTGFPVEYLSLGGIGPGVPVRATVSDFGAAAARRRSSSANETQEQSLVARLPLRRPEGAAAARPLRPARAADLPRLRRGQGRARPGSAASRRRRSACCSARSSGSRTAAATSSSASRSSTSTTCCARRRTAAAIISCLELPAVQDKPKLFSTALMWLLAELYEELPEVGDLDKPKLCFFFDEAHLLFDGATQGVPRLRHADRAADPLEGRRRLLHHADAEGRRRRRARAARQPRPARAARVHARTTRRRCRRP